MANISQKTLKLWSFMNENLHVLIKSSLMFVPMGPVNDMSGNGFPPNRQDAII